MIAAETLQLFCLSSLLMVLTPGPNQLFILAKSTSSRRAGVLASLGVDAGTLVHVLAAAFGMSALIASSGVALALIKYLGAAYLIGLGLHHFSRSGTPERSARVEPRGGHVFTQGMLTNVLNPKVALFFLAFLPHFVDASGEHVVGQLLVLGLVFVAIGLVVDLLMVVLASHALRTIKQTPVLKRSVSNLALSRVSASIYLLLGLGVALFGTQSS